MALETGRPSAWELSEETWRDGSFSRDSERCIKEEDGNEGSLCV
jgi:hypothetical protein